MVSEPVSFPAVSATQGVFPFTQLTSVSNRDLQITVPSESCFQPSTDGVLRPLSEFLVRLGKCVVKAQYQDGISVLLDKYQSELSHGGSKNANNRALAGENVDVNTGKNFHAIMNTRKKTPDLSSLSVNHLLAAGTRYPCPNCKFTSTSVNALWYHYQSGRMEGKCAEAGRVCELCERERRLNHQVRNRQSLLVPKKEIYTQNSAFADHMYSRHNISACFTTTCDSYRPRCPTCPVIIADGQLANHIMDCVIKFSNSSESKRFLQPSFLWKKMNVSLLIPQYKDSEIELLYGSIQGRFSSLQKDPTGSVLSGSSPSGGPDRRIAARERREHKIQQIIREGGTSPSPSEDTRSEQESLEVDVMKCHSESVTVCELCNAAYATEHQLIQHLAGHHKMDEAQALLANSLSLVPPKICDDCGKMFLLKLGLEKHRSFENDVCPIARKCCLCGARFATSMIYQHYRRYHEKFFRNLCKEKFCVICYNNPQSTPIETDDYMYHITIYHGFIEPSEQMDVDVELTLSCPACSSQFSGEGQLTDHMLSNGHTYRCPFKEVCGRFYYLSELEQHVFHSHHAEKVSWSDHATFLKCCET